ncbi:MAG: hypothetical protein NTV30_01115 [Chloroflexi bacterium]|nr:hypothetical protein [Chloroflexota bacterium]
MRVLIADNQNKEYSVIQKILDKNPGLTVVGYVDNADKLLDWIRENKADLLLVNRDLTGQNLSGILPVVHLLCPQLSVMALSKNISGQPSAFLS